jgi:metallo-beta-lactamase class B
MLPVRSSVRAGILALAALALVQCHRAVPEPLRSWLDPVEPLRVVGPVHFVGTRGLGVYLVTTPAGHILLSGAMPPSTAAIEASIRALGYRPEDIRVLLVNHAHADHVGTLADFKRLTGATVAVMDREVELLASGGRADPLYGGDPRAYYPPVTTDRVLRDGDTVELGGVTVTALLTAGHTRGSTTFTMTVEDGGVSYRVVFPDGSGINPGTRLVRQPSYPGILEDHRRTIGVLESLTPDIFLSYHTEEFDLPGKRARAATEGARAFVDPEGYRRRIAEAKARLEALVAQEQAAVSGPGYRTESGARITWGSSE